MYICVLTLMKRKEALRRTLTAPDTNEHGVDLQARRKTFDDLTLAVCSLSESAITVPAVHTMGLLGGYSLARSFAWGKGLLKGRVATLRLS